ncbi:MAG: glycosyltransferase family 2 protein [Thermoproteota archaeon]|nr:glycosyltransferase family 2 protein [Candidatus Brockarchaeota archaeon]
MNKRLKVSIGIPIYNEEENIQNLLNSIALQQEIDIVETIIINDGSTDNTLQRIMELDTKLKQNLKMEVINLERNRGMANALNIIFNKAKGDLLLIIPSDLFLPNPKSLFKLIEPFLYDHEVGLTSCLYKIVLEKSDIAGLAYRFSSFLLKEMVKIKEVYGIGAVWAVSKDVYSKITFPNTWRLDLYLYLFSKSLNKKFFFIRELEPFFILRRKNTIRTFISRQMRSRSIPQTHLNKFGESVKRELEIPLQVLISIMIHVFKKHPYEGICWMLLKTIAYLYRKIGESKVSYSWRKFEDIEV